MDLGMVSQAQAIAQNGLRTTSLAQNNLWCRGCRVNRPFSVDRSITIGGGGALFVVKFMFQRIKHFFGFGRATESQAPQQYYPYPVGPPPGVPYYMPQGPGSWPHLNFYANPAPPHTQGVHGYYPYPHPFPNGIINGAPTGFTQHAFPPIYQPPPYPPPADLHANSNNLQAAPPAQVIKEESVSFQWPDGNVKLECTTGQEPLGWDDQGWVWRSSGPRKQGLPLNAFKIDKRLCLGVFHCGCLSVNGQPKRFFRPKKEKAPREKQRSETCHICHSTLTYLPCDASITYYCYNDEDGVQHSVRHHHGRHEHPHPPIKSLPEADRSALDQQVRENPQLTAQQLRAGAGPTQVPLGEINPILLGSRKARSEVEKSKARQGIIQPAATRNSGFQLLQSLSALKDSFEVPWIVKSDIMDSNFVVMQTPFMREVLLQDQIRSWQKEILVAEGGRHGVVTDGCHDFFKQGVLLISLVFSPVIMRWAPVLFTWIGKLDAAHHNAHFGQLVYAIAEMCTRGLGYPFDERLYSAVLDFSAAQRNGFIDAFVDFMCARIPGWSTLSEQSRAAEAANLRTRAEALIQGCIVHWKRSLHKIKQTVSNQFLFRFEHLVGILEASRTTPAEFIQAVESILTEFPEVRPWLSWWILPGNGSMIFPAMRTMPADLLAKLHHSTNAAESGHWLLYCSVGSGFDLFEGIRRLYQFQREIELLYAAVTVGHVDARFQGTKPQVKSRIKWHENDGRAPDTRERLASVQKLEAQFAARNASLTDEERWLACLRYVVEHFWLRGLLSGSITASGAGASKPDKKKLMDALVAGQLNVKQLLKTKWKVTEYMDGSPLCSREWLHAMATVDAPIGVQKYFGVLHVVNYSCKAGHTLPFPLITIEPGVHFNDLLLAQQFVTPDSPAPLLDDYLMHAIPRGRPSPKAPYQPLHSGPSAACRHPSCNGAESPITSISTEWPLILRIDPLCRSYNPELHPPMAQIACPLTLSLGTAGTSVDYELIARVIFIPPSGPDDLGHYVTKTRLKGQTYLYNDLRCNGTLTELGPLHLLEDFDPKTAYVLYLRTSKTSITSRTVAELNTDFERVPDPRTSPIPISDESEDEDGATNKNVLRVNTPNPSNESSNDDGENDDEISQMLIDSITSPDKKSRTTSTFIYTPDENLQASPLLDTMEVVDPEQSFAETNSQTTCPVRCHGCGVNKPDGDDIYEVQCEKCKNWSHIECLPVGVDWHAEDVRFICQFCRDEDPLGSFLWPRRVVMVPDPSAPDWKAPDVKWYPARFIKYNKWAAPQRKYEFECSPGDAEEIEDIDLTAEQLGKVHLPFYLRPDYPEHKNPELTAIFTAATTPITKILAAFDITHPGVADFMQYFRGKKLAERRRGLNDWLARLQLVPTPELEEVLARPLIALMRHEALSKHSEEERNNRVFGVGSALLQMLAVQKELGEPLNLNGDMVDDMLMRRVIRCGNDGHMALNEMFAATQLPDVKTGELTRELLAFRNAHAIYDPDFRPPIYLREAPSMASPTKPVPVVLKRKAGAEAEVDGEKEPKRRKPSKTAKKDDPLTSEPSKDAPKRRLRSHRRKGKQCVLVWALVQPSLMRSTVTVTAQAILASHSAKSASSSYDERISHRSVSAYIASKPTRATGTLRVLLKKYDSSITAPAYSGPGTDVSWALNQLEHGPEHVSVWPFLAAHSSWIAGLGSVSKSPIRRATLDVKVSGIAQAYQFLKIPPLDLASSYVLIPRRVTNLYSRHPSSSYIPPSPFAAANTIMIKLFSFDLSRRRSGALLAISEEAGANAKLESKIDVGSGVMPSPHPPQIKRPVPRRATRKTQSRMQRKLWKEPERDCGICGSTAPRRPLPLLRHQHLRLGRAVRILPIDALRPPPRIPDPASSASSSEEEEDATDYSLPVLVYARALQTRRHMLHSFSSVVGVRGAIGRVARIMLWLGLVAVLASRGRSSRRFQSPLATHIQSPESQFKQHSQGAKYSVLNINGNGTLHPIPRCLHPSSWRANKLPDVDIRPSCAILVRRRRKCAD
ncbi:hypothetical protein C8R45DRAFT_946379 [Mycena sanguinolenta]|nr:hypothetical protein C8R45DRAFT_946379 [Mycena sanguinolenta]